MSRLVYLPASRALAGRLRSGGAAGPWFGYTASAALRSQLSEGDREPDADEAEYAALNLAGAAQLVDSRAFGLRLVLAAEVDAEVLGDPDVAGAGSVTVSELRWRQVTALFRDETDAADAVAAAREVAADRTVEEALGLPEVTDLVERHDLLWYSPDELDQL